MAHRVVVVGAGFGGLAVARHLRRSTGGPDVEISLIEANNFHTFQPLLYQVATAGLDTDDVAHPVRRIFQDRPDVKVIMARVTGADLDGHDVELDTGHRIAYDTLVLACGAVSNSFGVDGVDAHAFPLKDVEHAVTIRSHLLDRFESAVLDPELVADGALDVVVSGGGPTGVEMAGGIAELYHRVLARDFPDLDVTGARIVLVEPLERLLSSFTPESSERARQALERLGVEVRLGVGVDAVERHRVLLSDGDELRTHTTIWAAGVRANPLADAIDVPTGRGGRIEVAADLSLPDHPDVFAIGDVAAVAGHDDRPLPQVAQPAIQAGKHVARQIERRLRGEATETFRYVDKGSMATIGRREAVTELPGGRRFAGTIGWFAWLGLHLVYLMGFRNRINVFVNWCWNYLTYDRASRLLAASWRSRTSRPGHDRSGD